MPAPSYGEWVDDVDDALFTRAWLEENRVERSPEPADVTRIVVALDPADGSGGAGAEQALCAACITHRGHVYILRSSGERSSPPAVAEAGDPGRAGARRHDHRRGHGLWPTTHGASRAGDDGSGPGAVPGGPRPAVETATRPRRSDPRGDREASSRGATTRPARRPDVQARSRGRATRSADCSRRLRAPASYRPSGS